MRSKYTQISFYNKLLFQLDKVKVKFFWNKGLELQ